MQTNCFCSLVHWNGGKQHYKSLMAKQCQLEEASAVRPCNQPSTSRPGSSPSTPVMNSASLQCSRPSGIAEVNFSCIAYTKHDFLSLFNDQKGKLKLCLSVPKYRALFFIRTSLEMFFYLKNLSFRMRSFGLEKPPDLALDSVDPPFPYFFFDAHIFICIYEV